jgi:hypothetical protein
VKDVVVRPPTLADAAGVASLIVARDRADFGEVDPMEFTGNELREWWAMEEPRLATDAWIALRDGGVHAEPARALAEMASGP